ncbi:uncharacterized protein BKA55DRAFT_457824, partial [Fusarium redolens]
VRSLNRLEVILTGVTVKGQQAGWNCVEWVKKVRAAPQNNSEALGTLVLDWTTDRNTAMRYV